MDTDPQGNSFDSDVYTGFWINRSYRSTYGATLTLSRRNGSFLVAFLAIYVAMTGGSIWKIVRFSLHSFFSTPAAPDGVYHQHQAILRNAKTAPEAAQETLNVLIAWRKRGRRSLRRLLLILTLSILISACVAIAGVFSSRVTADQSNEVLLKGRGCGTSISPDINKDWRTAVNYRNKAYFTYLNIALQCYQGQHEDQSKCQAYTKPRLSYTVDNNASCPFGGQICQHAFDNILIDSGYLDSWMDLGINTEPRFKLRLKQHCAPLVTRGYRSQIVVPNMPLRRFMRYSYSGLNTSDFFSSLRDPTLLMVPMRSSSEKTALHAISPGTGDYKTSSISVTPDSAAPLVQELQRTDALVSLSFLDSTDLWSTKRVEDPWFAAMNNTSAEDRKALHLDWLLDSLYVSDPDEPASVIGCTSQLYYCNPKITDPKKRCANFYGPGASSENIAALWSESDDLKAFSAYVETNNVMIPTPDSFYNIQGLPSLLARFTLEKGIQAGDLPRDQWKREMEYTSQAALAAFQSNLPQTSQRGVFYFNRTLCESPTVTGLCEKLCKSQKVRSSEYYSFSVLGMAIIIFVGLFLMLVSAFLESIVAGINSLIKCDNKPSYSRLEWESNSFLHLQRLAHETLGVGSWSRSRTGVPITAPGEPLCVLNKHESRTFPILRHPDTDYEFQEMKRQSISPSHYS